MGGGSLPGVGGYLGDEDVGGRDGGVDDVGHFLLVVWVRWQSDWWAVCCLFVLMVLGR